MLLQGCSWHRHDWVFVIEHHIQLQACQPKNIGLQVQAAALLVRSRHSSGVFAAPVYPKNGIHSMAALLLLSQAALMSDNTACSCQVSATGCLAVTADVAEPDLACHFWD